MNYDDLHMLFLGLFVLILSAADLLFCRYFKRTKTMQTYEDVHNCVEFLLSLCPGMNDGVHILKPMKMGWFRLESWNGVDNESFFSHLLFIFSTHDALIEDEGIRATFANIVRNVYSLYVRVKVKKCYRSQEIDLLRKDIASVLSELQTLFDLKLNDSSDARIADSQYVFLEPVQFKHRSDYYKQFYIKKRQRGSDSEDESDYETCVEEESEPAERFTVDVCVNELPAATLSGHQTRTHKIHALTMIPEQIETNGSLDVGSTRIFETLHRLVKAFTRRSNSAKLGETERQVLKNSVNSVHKPLRSIKARLYNERHSNVAVNGTVSPSEEESDEDEENIPLRYVHAGTGNYNNAF
jgi:hypothetical protein